MTFFGIFDIPVFWPILLLYFIVLFFITMKRQIKHMIKFKYVPFSFGKTTYAAGDNPPAKNSK
jgi:predicted membrane protein